ncbi:MAG TPA: alpha/beta hydrolase [Alphaproteobacteria bacterium]|nr:alpha/beta hydrolase [Alphaproteobacteria bacterium]
MLEPESHALLGRLEEGPEREGDGTTIEAMRQRHRNLSRDLSGTPPAIPLVVNLTILGEEGAVPVRAYHPDPRRRLPVLVWFHGGGFVTGDLETHDVLCRRLAAGAGWVVINVGYRLAPEHPFPAAFNDACTVVSWALDAAEHVGGDPGCVSVGGSSAGGNLAAAVALAMRDRSRRRCACQLLIYPVLDATMSSRTYARYATGFALTAEKARRCLELYAGEQADPTHPYLSPFWAESVAELPPAHIIAAELDPLRGEAEAYYERLRGAGVAASITTYGGVMHGFFSQAGVLQKGWQAVEEACEVLRRTAQRHGAAKLQGHP